MKAFDSGADCSFRWLVPSLVGISPSRANSRIEDQRLHSRTALPLHETHCHYLAGTRVLYSSHLGHEKTELAVIRAVQFLATVESGKMHILQPSIYLRFHQGLSLCCQYPVSCAITSWSSSFAEYCSFRSETPSNLLQPLFLPGYWQ